MRDRSSDSSARPAPARGRLIQAKCSCGAAVRDQDAQCPACKARVVGEAQSAVTENLPSSLSGQGLPADLRSTVQPLFGRDFSSVRIHDDSASHAAAAALGARAFTSGQDIHFGAGEYRPAQPEGLRLISHELAHTVQQDGRAADAQQASLDTAAQQRDGLEAEADRAADAVLSGTPVRVSGIASAAAVQRDDKNKPPPKAVDPVEPSKKQQDMIDEARRAAAIRTQVAMFKIRGNHPHTGAMDRQEARSLARIKFSWDNPNMDQIDEVVSGMASRLLSVKVMVGGKNDPECGDRAGYVRGHRPPIVLCPAFFRDPAAKEERIRTMIHEAAHLAGIGDAGVAESYYPVFDCSSKGEFESADAWMHYVLCLNGTAQESETITAGGGTKSGNKKGGKK